MKSSAKPLPMLFGRITDATLVLLNPIKAISSRRPFGNSDEPHCQLPPTVNTWHCSGVTCAIL